ncbi:MAG: N-acetyltransferase [Bacteroidales bacterium]|nr:N-acetyltransferase [Bacteroidales bacterium]
MSYTVDRTAVVDEGCKIGEGTRIWHFSHLVSGCKVGKGCSIGQNVVVMGRAVIGDGVRIQNNVSVYDGVIVEDDVFIGPSAVFTNVVNPRAFISRKSEYRTTKIRRGASIGANATIVCGHEIGEYSLIGAGCVVTHDVKPYALIMGNPARQTGWVGKAGVKLEFDEEGIATCPMTGERYRIDREKEEVEPINE